MHVPGRVMLMKLWLNGQFRAFDLQGVTCKLCVCWKPILIAKASMCVMGTESLFTGTVFMEFIKSALELEILIRGYQRSQPVCMNHSNTPIHA